MDATVRFYTGVLGMPLVLTLMAGPMRHYFFEIAPGNTLAFFEIPEAEMFVKGADLRPSSRSSSITSRSMFPTRMPSSCSSSV